MNAEELEAEGWRPLIVDKRIQPPRNVIVEFIRDDRIPGDGRSWLGTFDELPDEFNIAGLYWRETK